MGRAREAWRVLRGRPAAPAAPATVVVPVVAPMATAVALTVEVSRVGGGDLAVINALLAEVPVREMPVVAASAAVLASTLGKELAVHDVCGAEELLCHIGLAAARQGS